MPRSSDTKLAKRHLLSSPLLKYIQYKNGHFLKFCRNYGANVTDCSKFHIKQISCEEITKECECQAEAYIETNKEKTTNNKKKKRLLNFVYFALNLIVIALVLYFQLSGETDPREQLSAIFSVNWWFILAVFGAFVAVMMFDQIRYAVLTYKSTGVFRPNLSYKITAIGRYYDVITPLATGGQPFQVLYYNKYGIKAGEGISIVMSKYIFSQIVFFLGATFFLFRNLFITGGGASGFADGLALTFSWIGYTAIAVVVFVVLLISLNKRIGAGFIVGILKFLSKIRIGKFRLIKDYKKVFLSVMRTVNVWQKTTRKAIKSPLVMITNILCSIGSFLMTYTIPFLIYCAFEGWHPELWVQIVTISIMVDLASAFNPIPMGTGTADLSFTTYFAGIFATTGAQVWALLIWRFMFYYIYIVQGFAVISYDYAIGNKKLEKYKEFWKLPIRERRRVRKEGKMSLYVSKH